MSGPTVTHLQAQLREAHARLFELRALLDRRPANNAGLFQTYPVWNGECYALDWLNATDSAAEPAPPPSPPARPTTHLTKADTVALWHACNWMESVLREWRRDMKPDDPDDLAKWQGQRVLLLRAKRALRKVNAIRKGQP